MKYIITSDENDSRADKIIKNICTPVSYVFLQKQFRLGKIRVNGKKISADYRVKTGDELFTSLQEKSAEFVQINPKFVSQLREMIIFENDQLFAINKPAGLAVQPGTKVNICVETFIKMYSPNSHLVHRLDKDTSGILVIAKNLRSAQQLTKLFRNGEVQKTYWAIVDGKIEKEGVINNLLGKKFVSGEEKMTVVENNEDGQQAITLYKTLKRVGFFSLLELRPKTGRKHQLRVHCSEVLKAPILGDVKYNKNCQHNNLFLHAKELKISSLNLHLEAPIPQYFYEILQ